MNEKLVLARIGLLILGYLFGCFQSAYFYGKAHGIDIREHGSGNAGTTNTLRVLGKKAGLIVFIGDLFKITVPCMVCGLIMDNFFIDNPDIYACRYLFKLYLGFGAVLGHNFPFYLKFKGGKGIATTSGMILGFQWMFIPMGLIVFFGTFAITHFVSLASILLMIGFVTEMCIMCIGHFDRFVIIADYPMIGYEMIAVSLCFATLAIVRHIPNIKRLATGTERKTYIFKKNKENISSENATENATENANENSQN